MQIINLSSKGLLTSLKIIAQFLYAALVFLFQAIYWVVMKTAKRVFRTIIFWLIVYILFFETNLGIKAVSTATTWLGSQITEAIIKSFPWK